MAKTEKHPKIKIPQGRCFLCIGPNCWGKGFTAEDAEKAARKNFWTSSSRGWKFLMFDAPPDVWVDDMGNTVYQPALYYQSNTYANDVSKDNFEPIGYAPKEIYRYGMKEVKR